MRFMNSLVNATNYQSAQALVASAQEIFNTELKPMALNNSSALVTKLENGLTELVTRFKGRVLIWI